MTVSTQIPSKTNTRGDVVFVNRACCSSFAEKRSNYRGMTLIVIPQVRVIAIGQPEVKRKVATDLPGISSIETVAIVGGHTRRRVEGQQVVADAKAYVAHWRIQKVRLGCEHCRTAEAGSV